MAEPQNYTVNLEGAASQRINPFLKGLTMLSGGLIGEFTGTNEQIRERNKARQALLQEELQKRDEQRTIERQLMMNALQQGVGTLEGKTLEERMADFNKKKLRREVAAAEGRVFGYGETMGPSQYQAEPAFQTAASESQAEMVRRGAELTQRQRLDAEANRQFLSGQGVQIPENATPGQLEAMRRTQDIKMQSAIPMEQRGEVAKATLIDLQKKGELPADMNIGGMTAAQAIAAEEPASTAYREKTRQSNWEKQQRKEQQAIKSFMQEAQKEAPDQSKLQEMFYSLPDDAQKDARNRTIAGVTSVATPKEREQLTKHANMLGQASRLAGSVAELAKNEDLSKVSQQNFNAFNSWLRGVQNKYGAENPNVALLNDIVQQFEEVVAGTRKDLFGASLTGTERESAMRQFGNPNEAAYLNRMIKFLDGVFSRDVVQEDYKDFGIQVPAGVEKRTQEARNAWLKARSGLQIGKRPGAGETAPGGKGRMSFDQEGNRIQ